VAVAPVAAARDYPRIYWQRLWVVPVSRANALEFQTGWPGSRADCQPACQPPESTHKKNRIFIIMKKHVFETARKHTHLCGEMRANFCAEQIYALLNVTESCHKKSKTIFSDMVDTTVLAPTPSGPECFGAAGAPVAVAAVAGVEALLPGPRTLL